MEQKVPMEGGGALRVWTEGLRVRAEARRPDDGLGLYKAYLKGPGGELLLGTMAPEGGELRIRRTFSQDELHRRGAWPVTGGAARLYLLFQGERPPAGWEQVEGSGPPLGEAALRQGAAALGRVLCRRQSGRLQVAVPFRTDRPFPLPALFCLARLGELEGRPHLFFLFDAGGWPLVQRAEGGPRR